MTTKRQRSVAMILAVAVAVPAAVALASPNTFVPGAPIRAADVNANFTAVDGAVAALAARVTALEAAAAARQSYFAEQAPAGGNFTGDANASVDDTWVDLPSVTIPLAFSAPTRIRYQLFARIYNFGAAAGTTTSCSVRIVQDDLGTALVPAAAPTTLGDWNGILTAGDTSPNNSHQVALGGLLTMPAGSYNFKVQVVRKGTAGTTNSGNCQISRWSFSRARFFVDVVP